MYVQAVSNFPWYRIDFDNGVEQLWEEVCRKEQKPVPRTFELRIVLGKLYAGGGSGIHERFSGQKFDSGIQFGCGTQKLVHYSG